MWWEEIAKQVLDLAIFFKATEVREIEKVERLQTQILKRRHMDCGWKIFKKKIQLETSAEESAARSTFFLAIVVQQKRS